MKKVLLIMLSVTMLMAFVTTYASAEEGAASFTYEMDGVEYTVEFENPTISYEKQKMIAEKLVGIRDDDGDVHPYGVWCSLFGHSTTTETAYVTVHKVRAASPRCDKKQYKVTTCSRCDYSVEEYVKTTSIVCCPVG